MGKLLAKREVVYLVARNAYNVMKILFVRSMELSSLAYLDTNIQKSSLLVILSKCSNICFGAALTTLDPFDTKLFGDDSRSLLADDESRAVGVGSHVLRGNRDLKQQS